MKIIDLTWRLPGPLATYLLAKQGMEVVKYEDRNHRDPFLKWSWDPAFSEVYRAFQEPKELRLIDFGSADDVVLLHKEIHSADAVVMSFPPRVEEKLGLTEEAIASTFSGVSFTRLGFRRGSDESAHDLNTLVQSNLLKMHILDRTDDIIAPPFLPVTGIFFSHHIAITLLTTILEQRGRSQPIQNWCWLQDAVDNAQEAYYPASLQERTPATFLHNGRFPCYNIYRTADGGYVAMACVEPKFWSRFRELTGLTQLGDDDGLCEGERSVEVKEIILNRISSKPAVEWKELFEEENVCVDVLLPSF
ncbi:MAG: CoA transferase [Ignavibacteriae bacterium]|nr:CoA transferase [Ignavibacteriota bacterium]MCB9216514.1 CoA transferase [Ignavibacteria bacterium]